ncbi:hypothetical protein NEDG_00936 [Nematocida displodere]|uniref:Uncharacterized protein n=1 Tax=Nematocida displodere TaxID=1805483 RepID=A0A177EA39_9MICR|nr:hypothetical protein NEDG_00936 [Nematocida displodere]
MEQKNQLSMDLETAVKKLLGIVNVMKELSTETEKMESFLIKEKEKVTALGCAVAVYSGFDADSEEAARFGKLVISNFLIKQPESIQFLIDALNQSITREELKNKILHFIHTLEAYLEADKQTLINSLTQELSVLSTLKNSSKAAADDQVWTDEIERLEEKMKTMIVSLQKPPLAQKKKHVPKKEIAVITQTQKKHMVEVLKNISMFTCFCCAQKNVGVSEPELTQELLLYILEWDHLAYLPIIPRLCFDKMKISIEMCSPTLVGVGDIIQAYQYALKMLQNLSQTTKQCVLEVREAVSYFERKESLPISLLRGIFIHFSPQRVVAISQALSSSSPTSLGINLVRLTYLVIHDYVPRYLAGECLVANVQLKEILKAVNKDNHQSLIASMLPNTVPVPEDRPAPTNPGLVTFQDLISTNVTQDMFYVVRLVSDGIFIPGSLLYPYFQERHRLRQTILVAASEVVVEKTAGLAYLKQKYPKMSEEELIQQQKIIPIVVPESLRRLVRQRLFGLVRIQTQRCLKSCKPISEFVKGISTKDFVSRGIFGHTEEVHMFITSSLPLLVFAAYSLQ